MVFKSTQPSPCIAAVLHNAALLGSWLDACFERRHLDETCADARKNSVQVVSGCDTENVKRKHAKFLTHPEGSLSCARALARWCACVC